MSDSKNIQDGLPTRNSSAHETQAKTREGFYLSEDGEWVPDGWLNLPLNQVVSDFIDYRGKTPKKTTSGIPLITAKVVKNGRVFPTQEYIAESDYEAWMRRGIPNEKDVILTTEAPLGEVAFIPEGKIALAQRIITLRGEKDKLDNGFLKYSLQSPLMQYRLVARESGSTVSGIKSSELKVTDILHPSDVNEQKAIAAVLGSLDDKIELLREQNETLEALAQTLFKRWFIDFNFPDENGNPYKDSGGKMIPSELGEIPEGWRIGKLGEISNTTSGGTPSRKEPSYYNGGTIPWVKSKELCNGYICSTEETITLNGLKKSSAKLLPENTILLAMYGATVGQLAILSKESTCNQAICAFLPQQEYGTPYTYLLLQNQRRNWMELASGSAQQNLSQVTMRNLSILIPPSSLAKEFCSLTEQLWEKIKTNTQQIQTLTSLRDTLLPKLMKGEIRIKEVDFSN